MAIVSEAHGYLFIHAPRTGGTALAEMVLVRQLEGRRVPKQRIEVQSGSGGRRTVRQHATLDHLIEAGLVTPEDAQRLLVFTTVRNPFDSLVSGYVKRRTTGVGKPWTTRNDRVRELMQMEAEL
ncbi:MAG: hypothetical protein WKF43_07690 [Acidimicrobiales bacterium]